MNVQGQLNLSSCCFNQKYYHRISLVSTAMLNILKEVISFFPENEMGNGKETGLPVLLLASFILESSIALRCE